MLSTKFKVSFVKPSLEIKRSLKDILHNVATSNLIIISYGNHSCELKDGDEGKIINYTGFRGAFPHPSTPLFCNFPPSRLTSNGIKCN